MAKLFTGKAKFGFAFNQTGAQPLDDRSVVQSYADLLNADTFGAAIYNGMVVATVDEQKVYMLVDKTKATSKDGWKEVGSGNGSLALSAFTISAGTKIFEATAENIGQIIYVTGGTESYPAGPYIVIAAGEVSKLGTTTATGDIPGDVEALKTRVSNVELNKADLTGLTALQTVVSGKVDNTTFVEHSEKGEIHVNATDKAKWNNAASASTENTTNIANLTLVVGTKADASALTGYVKTEDAYNDTEVRGLITAETAARTEAFNTLSGAVDTKVSISDFNTLTGTVETNYNALNSLITAETTARTEAISSLTTTVNTKASNDDLTTHTTNGDIHVTSDDKNKWNKVVEDFNTFITGDTEAALNTLVDLQQWINEHGTEAQAMATAITANLESITALTQTVDTISGKVESNITAITKNANDIATKAAQSDLAALAEIVGNETDNSGIFAKLNTLAGNVYTKNEADGKFLTGITVDAELSSTSSNPIQNKAVHAEFIKVRDEITSAVTGDVSAVLTNYLKKDQINTLNDIALYGDSSISLQVLAGNGVEVTTDANAKTITVSPKISAAEKNALTVDENGLFVQAVIIDGNDVEL